MPPKGPGQPEGSRGPRSSRYPNSLPSFIFPISPPLSLRTLTEDPHSGPSLSLPSTSSLPGTESSSICLTEPLKEGRAGQGKWYPFHSRKTEAREIK